MRDAFIRELTGLAEKDPSVMLITGDLGFGVLEKFAKTFPEQFVNAGVAEQNMTALACGMAMEGHKVYTYSIGNFTTLRPLEFIRNDVCYHDADVTVVSVGGGFSYGQLGMSHFSTEDLAIMRALPNMQVIAPADVWEASQLVRQMAMCPGPKYLRLDKGRADTEEQKVELGSVRTVREGRDLTIISIGAILREAVLAAEQLAAEGISVRLLSVSSLKPLDVEKILLAAEETRGLITLEEHTVIGGLGSAVAEVCVENGITPSFFCRLGLRDVFPTEVGDQDHLRRLFGLDADSLVGIVKSKLDS